MLPQASRASHVQTLLLKPCLFFKTQAAAEAGTTGTGKCKQTLSKSCAAADKTSDELADKT